MSVSHGQTTSQLSQDALLSRVNSGNPAVPVAHRQTAATQRSPMPGDSTDRSLSFGKPSADCDGSNTVDTLPSRLAVVEAQQEDSMAASTSTAAPETAGTQQEESMDQTAASPSPVSMQARDQNVARQQHDMGTSALGQAMSGLSAAEASGQAPGHIDDRSISTEVQLASRPGSAMTWEAQVGVVEPASSSHQILEQQGNTAASAGAHSSRDPNDPVSAPLSDADTRLGAAQEGIQSENSRLPDPGEWHDSLSPAEGVPKMLSASVMALSWLTLCVCVCVCARAHDHHMVLVGQCVCICIT